RFHKPDGPGGSPGARGLALRTLLGHFLAACQAVAYAHSRGVLHRDIKPANIMIGPYGETLVVDWGLARPFDRAGSDGPGDGAPAAPRSAAATETLAGTALGTPAYMSPEQAAGDLEALGPPSDVYGLGATLYCLLTGRSPFEAPDFDVGSLLAKVRRGEFP